jgi:hypothetical protein
MDDNFDKELREMAKNSSIKEPWDIRSFTKSVCEDNKKIYRNRHSSYKTIIVAASIFIFFTISIGTFLKVNADEIPIINRVLEYFTKNNKIDNGYEGNTVEQNYLTNENKYNVNIEDIYFDGDSLVLFYKIKSDEVLDKSKIYYLNTKLDINADIDAGGGLEEKEFINDYTYAGMISYGIFSNSSESWPDKLNGTITINSIDIYGEDNSLETISINKEPLTINLDSKNVKTEELLINKNISYNGLVSEVTKIIKSPTGITMEVLNGDTWNEDKGVYFLTYLWDSKKGLLKFQGKTNDNADNGIIRERYENPSEDGELSIISFVSESGAIGNPDNQIYNLSEGAELDLGNLGKLTVDSIVDKDNKTLITMRTIGYISTIDLQVFNGNAKYLSSEIINKEVYGDLDMKATYVFPKLNIEEGLTISLYHPKLLEQLSNQTIKIDLSNFK